MHSPGYITEGLLRAFVNIDMVMVMCSYENVRCRMTIYNVTVVTIDQGHWVITLEDSQDLFIPCEEARLWVNIGEGGYFNINIEPIE